MMKSVWCIQKMSIEIMMNIKVEIIGKFFDSLKNGYQNYLESMEGGDFVFDYVHCLTGQKTK